MEEFKRFSIPVKWRKYVWLGVIGGLVFAIKWLAGKTSQLEQELKDCNREKVNLMESRRKADSVLMERFMRQALDRANEDIIQPKIDSMKADKS